LTRVQDSGEQPSPGRFCWRRRYRASVSTENSNVDGEDLEGDVSEEHDAEPHTQNERSGHPVRSPPHRTKEELRSGHPIRFGQFRGIDPDPPRKP